MTPACVTGIEPPKHRRPRFVTGLIALVVTGCAAQTPSAPLENRQPDPLQPATIVWLASRVIEVNDVPMTVRLTLGRGDGMVLWRGQVEVDPSLPSGGIGFASGPSGGVFTYALIGGEGATVHAVSATDPQDRVVATIEEPLVSGSLNPSGEWIYLATHPNDDQLRISRIPVNGGEVEYLVDVGPEFLPNGVTSPQDLLRWTPDGTRLLIQACDATAAGCWWQVLEVATGELTELRPAGAELAVGVTNDTMLAIAARCAVGPCPFVLVDLATGESQPFDPRAHEARTAITQDGHTVILYDNQGVGGGATIRITAHQPTTGMERVVYESDAGFGLAREGQGDWAPAGWFVVAPGGMSVGERGMGPVLIRIADGLEVRLASLAE